MDETMDKLYKLLTEKLFFTSSISAPLVPDSPIGDVKQSVYDTV